MHLSHYGVLGATSSASRRRALLTAGVCGLTALLACCCVSVVGATLNQRARCAGRGRRAVRAVSASRGKLAARRARRVVPAAYGRAGRARCGVALACTAALQARLGSCGCLRRRCTRALTHGHVRFTALQFVSPVRLRVGYTLRRAPRADECAHPHSRCSP